jgi:DNA invertase Pin-like site-specific DNA recombinase
MGGTKVGVGRMQKRHLEYRRVSTRSQSVESQKNALAATIGKLEEPCETLTDVWTGANTDRSDYQKMLAAVRNGEVISIIAYRIDRIGRDCYENLTLVKACRENDVDIIGVADGIRLKSPQGPLMISILSAIAEYLREIIVENTLVGMDTAKKAKKICGGGFKGYTDDRVIRLVPHIKSMKEQGLSTYAISQTLRIDRKTLQRVWADIEAGRPLRSRASMLREIPWARRGKDYQAANPR